MSNVYANPSYRARRASYTMRLGMGSAVLAPRPYRTKAAAVERARAEVADYIRRTEAFRDAPAPEGCTAEAVAGHRQICEVELGYWRVINAALCSDMAGAWPRGGEAWQRVTCGRFYVEIRRLAPGEDAGFHDTNIRSAA